MPPEKIQRYQQANLLPPARPDWLVAQSAITTVTNLDSNAIYSQTKYWNVDRTQADPGMPGAYKMYTLHFFRTSPNAKCIVSLNCEHCNLGDKVVLKLVEILSLNNSLKKLNLKDNNITCKAMMKLLDILEPTNYTIVELELDEGKKTVGQKSDMLLRSFATERTDLEAIEPEHIIFETKVKPKLRALLKSNSRLQEVCSINLTLGLLLTAWGNMQGLKTGNLDIYCKNRAAPRALLVNLLLLAPGPQSLRLSNVWPPPPAGLKAEKTDYVFPEELFQLNQLQVRYLNQMVLSSRFDGCGIRSFTVVGCCGRIKIWTRTLLRDTLWIYRQ